MTVLEAIQKSRTFLEGKGVESARLESEWMLGSVLKLERLQLYLNFERVLTSEEEASFREMVKRRGQREPLQHILGTALFCGFEITVNPDVLVPRPETELLAEAGWGFLNELGRPGVFLDFGTGSGCIAVALCRKSPEAHGWALDKSTAALNLARQNALHNRVSDRLTFIESDGMAQLPPNKFDLIISNPPYIPAAEIESLQPEVRQFDPRAALDGGADGLDFYRLLAAEAPHFLGQGGKLLAEFGDNQAEAISAIFSDASWTCIRISKDLAGRPRIIEAGRT